MNVVVGNDNQQPAAAGAGLNCRRQPLGTILHNDSKNTYATTVRQQQQQQQHRRWMSA